MKIKALKSFSGAADGFTMKNYLEGEIYEVEDGPRTEEFLSNVCRAGLAMMSSDADLAAKANADAAAAAEAEAKKKADHEAKKKASEAKKLDEAKKLLDRAAKAEAPEPPVPDPALTKP